MFDFQAELEKRLEEGRLQGCFPSAAAAVGVGERVLAEAFTGEAPVPGDVPVDAHTRYDMASLSKVIGPTMIALRAMEEGQLDLRERIGDFFPEAPADKREITVEQLMTHTGGFHPSFRLDRMGIAPEAVKDAILARPLEAAPGTQVIYSCMGYILFAKMLEKRFGKPLDALAEERVFTPLGLKETGYRPLREGRGDGRDPKGTRFAATEMDPERGEPWIGAVHDENARFQGGISGNAGVFMPLEDAIRFAQMLARMGGSYLKRETMESAIRCRTEGLNLRRGLGFQLAGTPECFFGEALPARCFGHTGFTGTCLLVEPESGFWAVLLSNRVYPTRNSDALFPFRRRLHSDFWRAFEARQGHM